MELKTGDSMEAEVEIHGISLMLKLEFFVETPGSKFESPCIMEMETPRLDYGSFGLVWRFYGFLHFLGFNQATIDLF